MPQRAGAGSGCSSGFGTGDVRPNRGADLCDFIPAANFIVEFHRRISSACILRTLFLFGVSAAYAGLK
ncbi:hypothetical protein M569_15038 [Genlisea aurea]|uniref:Uncharacterized protein n=1 Tax=Genlisea aurea TaxID=192259 RepID=S8DAP2_9LAMI|nr:hypothetical protein M569_15038 [Genlisea aurea]